MRSQPAREWRADYRTGTGERREATLADGTHLTLNTASAVDVAYDGEYRLLRLRAGEILVQTAQEAVQAHARRPFVVETMQGMVRALGTRFMVRQHADHSRVAALEGAVELCPGGPGQPSRIVPAGWQAAFSGAACGEIMPLPAHVDAWSRGMLYADRMSLEAFIAELERYRSGILRCDPAVAQLPVSGIFQLRDTGPILDSLPNALPVDIVYRTRYWATVVPARGR